MATKKAPAKKAPITKGQASKVADFLKGQKGNMQTSDNGPALPNPAKSNPITTADDNDED